MKYLFLVANTQTDNIEKEIQDEIRIYGDILIGSFLDAYHNLTLKSIMMLRWFQDHCHHAKFLLKVDDNVHVNLPLLLSKLHTNDRMGLLQNNILGHVKWSSYPIRNKNNSKWFVPKELYPDKHYPPYADGPSYIMSGASALKLLPVCKSIPVIHIEDVYITGLCRFRANIDIAEEYTFCQGIMAGDTRHLAGRCSTEHRIGNKKKRFQRMLEPIHS